MIIEGGNPLTADTLEKFRTLLDSNEDIQKKATVDSFIEECQWMEDFYSSTTDKPKCLPMYQAMLERLAKFITLNPQSTGLALLQCLYTLTLSKICQMKAAKESRLIIDIKAFIDLVQQNVKTLDKLDHDIQVKIYEEQYDKRILSKITEKRMSSLKSCETTLKRPIGS